MWRKLTGGIGLTLVFTSFAHAQLGILLVKEARDKGIKAPSIFGTIITGGDAEDVLRPYSLRKEDVVTINFCNLGFDDERCKDDTYTAPLIEQFKRAKATINFSEETAKSIAKEIERAGQNTEDLVLELEPFIRHQIKDFSETVSETERKFREGKLISAFWHFTVEPLRDWEDNTFDLMEDAKLARYIGEAAAYATYGPGGSAAFAAWYAYKESCLTVCDYENAIKAGIITGAMTYAGAEVGKIDDAVIRAVVTGALGGASVAASGGDEKEIIDAFITSGGMVIVKEHYHEITQHELNQESFLPSDREAFCLKITSKLDDDPCMAKYLYQKNADGSIKMQTKRKQNGKPWLDADDKEQLEPILKSNRPIMGQLDKRASHVGLHSGIGDSGPFHFVAGERGPVMDTFSKIPGMNAMSVYHDQIGYSMVTDSAAINWITTIGTIPPAIVLTYYGSPVPINEKILSAINNRSIDSSSDSIDIQNEVYAHSFLCTKANELRAIEIVYPERGENVCEVQYFKSDGNKVQTLWSAKNEIKYCNDAALPFVVKHINDWGWKCSVK